MSEIGSKLPKDQSQTIENYEFQLGEASRSALKMLDSSILNHVLCEWHDDYVEVHSSEAGEEYVFCQVKGKASGQKKFNFTKIFGVAFSDKVNEKTKKILTLKEEGILFKQFETFLKFPSKSKSFKIITNHEFEQNVNDFISYVQSGFTEFKTNENEFNFSKLVGTYEKYLEKEDLQDEIVRFLSIVELSPEANSLKEFKLKVADELRSKLEHIKESAFLSSQINLFVENILLLARAKSQTKLNVLPKTYQELLDKKGITIKDLLEHIGVSHDIFSKAFTETEERLITLRNSSRLERFLEHEDEDFKAKAIECKILWDQWVKENKERIRHQQEQRIKGLIKDNILINHRNEVDLGDAITRLITVFKEEKIQFSDDGSLNENIIIGCVMSMVCEYGGLG